MLSEICAAIETGHWKVEMIELLHRVLVWAHVGAGFLGLILFWIPVFSKKGGRIHRVTGKIFVACGYLVAVSAIVSCFWGLISPLEMAGYGDLTGEKAEQGSRQIRYVLSLLLLLGTLLFCSLRHGMRAIRAKSDPSILNNLEAKLLLLFKGTISAGLLAFGAFGLSNYNPSGWYWVQVAFGMMGLRDSWNDWKRVKSGFSSRMQWWYEHMDQMLSCGIAYHTAFVIFGATRLLGIEEQTIWTVIPWVIPAAIGMPAIYFWTRYYRKKFKEL